MRAKGFATAHSDGRLPPSRASPAGPLLLDDLAVGARHLPARLGRGGALARVVALVDDGALEEVPTEGEVEVLGQVLCYAEGFEGGKAVEGYGDGGC